jgi:hypothetical protein
MEDRIVTSVDSIPTIHIGGDRIAIAEIRAERVDFVGARVRSQNGVLVHVVRVGLAATRMVRGET